MKKSFIALAAIAAAISFTSCENIPEQAPSLESAPLSIKVGVQTKGLITETTLPDASEIGTFFYDESGTTYDELLYQNIKFTASGEAASQTWITESMIRASNTKGTLSAYYPYSDAITDITSIPVSATPENQIDYMWANPAGNIDYKNASTQLTMNHALAVIRLNIERGGYTGTGEITKIYLGGENIAQSATLDATTGALSEYQGAGENLISSFGAVTLSDTPSNFEYIVVPVTGASDVIDIAIVLDGMTFAVATPAVELKQNTIYEYTLSMTTDIVLSSVAVKTWMTEINNTPIMVETTQPISAKIKHVDGTLYSAGQWTAALSTGAVTNDQVVGVAVPHPENPLAFLCVVHPTAQQYSTKWSSNTTVLVDGVFKANTRATAAKDYAGQANTNALLAAVAAGTIEDAPAAQYCASITFADGKVGYLPAMGELLQMKNCETEINACLTACGGTKLISSDQWSSTQYSTPNAWYWDWTDRDASFQLKTQNAWVRVVTAF